jgi:hypothetical protein
MSSNPYADFATAKATSERLEAEYEAAGRALSAISGGGPLGLTPASVRATPEWQAAKKASDTAFSRLRVFNAVYARIFKKEIARERDERRARRKS